MLGKGASLCYFRDLIYVVVVVVIVVQKVSESSFLFQVSS